MTLVLFLEVKKQQPWYIDGNISRISWVLTPLGYFALTSVESLTKKLFNTFFPLISLFDFQTVTMLNVLVVLNTIIRLIQFSVRFLCDNNV